MAHNSKSLKATKLKEYVIEPKNDGISAKWEGHHTTNPAAIRLSCDRRVFLGYRAGGDDDTYCVRDKIIWGSSLGLAILDERGEKILYRFPLPVMKMIRDIALPQTEEEYNLFIKEYADKIVVMHDFRLFEFESFLYVIYHDGIMGKGYDCVKRMKLDAFLQKIARSIQLMDAPAEEILGEWSGLWWGEDVWEACGVNGTRLIYPSDNNKNDIIFFKKADGMLQMCHRPLPDIAVLDTGKDLHAEATPDGITTYGSLESCIRPGYFDNSHIGNNGFPTRAKIGDVDVYIDVLHGVHNKMISSSDSDKTRAYLYLPYFRVKDFETGELLYYSENPILERDEIWKEYVEEGAWIQKLTHLQGVMFAGGQVETEPGKNGLGDQFAVYMGVGDTAVAKAVFVLADLLPDQVIEDIKVRKQHKRHRIEEAPAVSFRFPEKICGWDWIIENDAVERNIHIIRELKGSSGLE